MDVTRVNTNISNATLCAGPWWSLWVGRLIWGQVEDVKLTSAK